MTSTLNKWNYNGITCRVHSFPKQPCRFIPYPTQKKAFVKEVWDKFLSRYKVFRENINIDENGDLYYDYVDSTKSIPSVVCGVLHVVMGIAKYSEKIKVSVKYKPVSEWTTKDFYIAIRNHNCGISASYDKGGQIVRFFMLTQLPIKSLGERYGGIKNSYTVDTLVPVTRGRSITLPSLVEANAGDEEAAKQLGIVIHRRDK